MINGGQLQFNQIRPGPDSTKQMKLYREFHFYEVYSSCRKNALLCSRCDYFRSTLLPRFNPSHAQRIISVLFLNFKSC